MKLVRFSGVCAGVILSFLAESANATTLWEWFTGAGEPGGQAPTLIHYLRNLTLPLFSRKDFDAQKVRLVDHYDQNVVIRTPNPLIGGKFAEHEFYKAIKSVLPDWFSQDILEAQIVVFNLMVPLVEYEEYSVEKSWFQAQQNGEFRSYPQLGSFLPARWVPKWMRDYLIHYHRHFFLSAGQAVDDLRSEIMTQGDKPKIIIVHCVKGQDRTGMIVGDYQMAGSVHSKCGLSQCDAS